MEQGKKLVYLAAILGVILLMTILAYLIVSQKKVISPLPEGGVKVIFQTPKP